MTDVVKLGDVREGDRYVFKGEGEKPADRKPPAAPQGNGGLTNAITRTSGESLNALLKFARWRHYIHSAGPDEKIPDEIKAEIANNESPLYAPDGSRRPDRVELLFERTAGLGSKETGEAILNRLGAAYKAGLAIGPTAEQIAEEALNPDNPLLAESFKYVTEDQTEVATDAQREAAEKEAEEGSKEAAAGTQYNEGVADRLLSELSPARTVTRALEPVAGSDMALSVAQTALSQMGLLSQDPEAPIDYSKTAFYSAETFETIKNPVAGEPEAHTFTRMILYYLGYAKAQRAVQDLEAMAVRTDAFGLDLKLRETATPSGETVNERLGVNLFQATQTLDWVGPVRIIKDKTGQRAEAIAALPAEQRRAVLLDMFEAARAVVDLNPKRDVGTFDDAQRRALLDAVKNFYDLISGTPKTLWWMDPALFKAGTKAGDKAFDSLTNLAARIGFRYDAATSGKEDAPKMADRYNEYGQKRLVEYDAIFTKAPAKVFRRWYVALARDLMTSAKSSIKSGTLTALMGNPLLQIWVDYQTQMRPPNGTIKMASGKLVSNVAAIGPLDAIVPALNRRFKLNPGDVHMAKFAGVRQTTKPIQVVRGTKELDLPPDELLGTEQEPEELEIDGNEMDAAQQDMVMRAMYDMGGQFVLFPVSGDLQSNDVLVFPRSVVEGTTSFEEAFSRVMRATLEASFGMGLDLKASTLIKRSRLLMIGGQTPQIGKAGGLKDVTRVLVLESVTSDPTKGPVPISKQADGMEITIGEGTEAMAIGFNLAPEVRIFKGHTVGFTADGLLVMGKVATHLDDPSEKRNPVDTAVRQAIATQDPTIMKVSDINGYKIFPKTEPFKVTFTNPDTKQPVTLSGWVVSVKSRTMRRTTNLEHDTRPEIRYVSSPVITDTARFTKDARVMSIMNWYVEQVKALSAGTFVPADKLDPIRDAVQMRLMTELNVPAGSPLISHVLQRAATTHTKNLLRPAGSATYFINRVSASAYVGQSEFEEKWTNDIRELADGTFATGSVLTNAASRYMRPHLQMTSAHLDANEAIAAKFEKMREYEALKYALRNTDRKVRNRTLREKHTELFGSFRDIYNGPAKWMYSCADLFDRNGSNDPKDWIPLTSEVYLNSRVLPSGDVLHEIVFPGSLDPHDRNPGGGAHAHPFLRWAGYESVRRVVREHRDGTAYTHTLPGLSNVVVKNYKGVVIREGSDNDADASQGRLLTINPDTLMPYTREDYEFELRNMQSLPPDQKATRDVLATLSRAAANELLLEMYRTFRHGARSTVMAAIDKSRLGKMQAIRNGQKTTLDEAAVVDEAEDHVTKNGGGIKVLSNPAKSLKMREATLDARPAKSIILAVLRNGHSIVQSPHIDMGVKDKEGKVSDLVINMPDGTTYSLRRRAHSAEDDAAFKSNELAGDVLQTLVNMVIDVDPQLRYLGINKHSAAMMGAWVMAHTYSSEADVSVAMEKWQELATSQSMANYVAYLKAHPRMSSAQRRSNLEAKYASDATMRSILVLAAMAAEMSELGQITTLQYKTPRDLASMSRAKRAYDKAIGNEYKYLANTSDVVNDPNETAASFKDAFDTIMRDVYGMPGDFLSKPVMDMLTYMHNTKVATGKQPVTGPGPTATERIVRAAITGQVVDALTDMLQDSSSQGEQFLTRYLMSYFASPVGQAPDSRSMRAYMAQRTPGDVKPAQVVKALRDLGIKIMYALERAYATKDKAGDNTQPYNVAMELLGTSIKPGVSAKLIVRSRADQLTPEVTKQFTADFQTLIDTTLPMLRAAGQALVIHPAGEVTGIEERGTNGSVDASGYSTGPLNNRYNDKDLLIESAGADINYNFIPLYANNTPMPMQFNLVQNAKAGSYTTDPRNNDKAVFKVPVDGEIRTVVLPKLTQVETTMVVPLEAILPALALTQVLSSMDTQDDNLGKISLLRLAPGQFITELSDRIQANGATRLGANADVERMALKVAYINRGTWKATKEYVPERAVYAMNNSWDGPTIISRRLMEKRGQDYRWSATSGVALKPEYVTARQREFRRLAAAAEAKKAAAEAEAKNPSAQQPLTELPKPPPLPTPKPAVPKGQRATEAQVAAARALVAKIRTSADAFVEDESGTHYRNLVDGKRYLRVSSILQSDPATRFDPGNAFEAGELESIVAEGAQAHTIGENYLQHPETASASWAPVFKQLEILGLTPIAYEVTVLDNSDPTAPFGGTIDVIAVDANGKLVVIDLKSSMNHPFDNVSTYFGRTAPKHLAQTQFYTLLLDTAAPGAVATGARGRYILPIARSGSQTKAGDALVARDGRTTLFSIDQATAAAAVTPAAPYDPVALRQRIATATNALTNADER